MAKAKSSAIITFATGNGNMAELSDQRFESIDVTIDFEVKQSEADDWLRYFGAECGKHNWSCAMTSQLEAQENSGTIQVNAANGTVCFLIVWERKFDGPMKAQARLDNTSSLSLMEVREFIDVVTSRSNSGSKEQHFRRGQLHYDGLDWRGEYWLNDKLRLAPSSNRYEQALLGPRIIMVDTIVEGVGVFDASAAFQLVLSELAVFLSVVMGKRVYLATSEQVWVYSQDLTQSEVRTLGYVDNSNLSALPAKGTLPPVPLLEVQRPDFSLRGIGMNDVEYALPSDAAELWDSFRKLSADERRSFLCAASKWQEALLLWRESKTLSFALMVVACESLKPDHTDMKDADIYFVVKALLGKETAKRLQRNLFDAQVHAGMHPQQIRNDHFHRGHFLGSEFLQWNMFSTYYDPTFDQAHRELSRITQAAIIEWLRNPRAIQRKTARRTQK